MIKTTITDIRNGNIAHLHNDDNLTGLIVNTRPLKTFENRVLFFVNETFGAAMNQNGVAGGDPLNVHNGLDNIYWTASIINGNTNRFLFNSIDQANTGAQSIKCTAVDGNSFQLLNNTLIQSNDYATFEGWIYIASAWTPNVDGLTIQLYNTILGTVVSEKVVNLRDYIGIATTNTWQKFTIPMSDFGGHVSYNAIRCIINENGTSNFYLDDLAFIEISDTSAISYEVTPDVGKWLHVKRFTFTYVDEYGTNGLLKDIPYNSFFGVPYLENGIVYQRRQGNEIKLSLDIHSHIDLMHFGVVTHVHHGFDGTNSWCTVIAEAEAPLTLKSEFEDSLRFIVSDNLMGLDLFQVSVSCEEENRCLVC